MGNMTTIIKSKLILNANNSLDKHVHPVSESLSMVILSILFLQRGQSDCISREDVYIVKQCV